MTDAQTADHPRAHINAGGNAQSVARVEGARPRDDAIESDFILDRLSRQLRRRARRCDECNHEPENRNSGIASH
jgi:hypothetical protein